MTCPQALPGEVEGEGGEAENMDDLMQFIQSKIGNADYHISGRSVADVTCPVTQRPDKIYIKVALAVVPRRQQICQVIDFLERQ